MSNAEMITALALLDVNDPDELAAYLGSIYPIPDKDQAEIDNDFTYHAPTPEQIKKFPLIRKEAKALTELIYRLVPGSPERTLAKRAIEIAVFWANAGIARKEGNNGQDADPAP